MYAGGNAVMWYCNGNVNGDGNGNGKGNGMAYYIGKIEHGKFCMPHNATSNRSAVHSITLYGSYTPV